MKHSFILLLSALVIITFYSCTDEPPVLPGLTKSGITVITEPDSVSISINNKSYDGRSPLRIGELEPGFYKMDLRKDTYVDTVIYMLISRNVEDTFFVEMKENPKLFWTIYRENNSTLPSNNVSKVIVDAQNNVWVGTRGKGLVKITESGWTIINTGLADNFINNIAIDKNNGIWVGTRSGISYYNGVTWKTYNITNSNIPDNYINTLAVDKYDNVWIGTNLGLCKFDGIKFITYTVDNSLLLANEVKSIFADDNVVWIGTWGGGLNRIEGEKWNSYNTVRGRIANNYISSIIKDKNGVLWFGSGAALHGGGLTSYNGTSFKNYYLANGIPLGIVTSLALDSKENLWIGSTAGLVKYDGSRWRLYTTTNSGLPSDAVISIAIDKNDDKWIAAGALAKYIGGK